MSQKRCNHVDFGVFLSLWNATQTFTTPGIHFRIGSWLQKCWENGEKRLLLQAFRASGKSTLVGLFSAWALYRDPDLRILVLSAESSLAEKMVRSIRKTIEKHPLTASLNPENPDQWASDSFTVRRRRSSRDPSVLGRGLYANTTGARADFIICDDVEVPNTCDTAEKREKLRERLAENEFILTPGGTQLFIGTPHSFYTIYADAPRQEIGEDKIFLQHYARYSAPLLDGDGICAWPERYKKEDVERLRRLSGPAKFASQMMLEPVNILNARLDPALLRRYADPLLHQEIQQKTVLSIGGRKLVSAACFWDPAFGRARGDASVLAVVYADGEGNRFLHRLEYIKVEPKEGEDEANLQCRIVADIARELYLPSVTVETNGIGAFLPAILQNVMARERVPCSVLPHHASRAKADRILEAYDVTLAARSLYVHDSVYKTPFIREMQEWTAAAKNARDDGLDAVAGALLSKPLRLLRSYAPHTKPWNGAGDSQTARTEFDVL